MPIFYNQAYPTSTNKNTINSVTINIRDFLLTKNLSPQYPALGTSINGSPKGGEPVLDTMGGSGTVVIPNFLPLETNGITFKNNVIIKNLFINKQSTADDLTQINDVTQIKNTDYLNSYWPQGNYTYPTSPTDEVTQFGIIGKTNEAQYRKKNVIKNLYLDVDKQVDAAVFIDFNIPPITKQLKGYRDEYGDLNLGGSDTIQAIDTIGSILNGQGIGFAKGGIVNNFDIRSSLAGRVLGATGLINDTKLGIIGGQQLALALANNAGFNLQQDLFSIFTGPNVDYKITIPTTTGGRIANDVAKILGFTVPTSFLDDSGSIFQTESQQVTDIDRSNAMLVNTGSGQFKALLKNANSNLNGISPFGVDNPLKSKFRTGYAPAYKDNKGQTQITAGFIYAFSNDGVPIDSFSSEDGITYDINKDNTDKISEYGFKSPEELEFIGHRNNPVHNTRKLSDIQFSWGSENGEALNADGDYAALVGDKKSLLVKTQQLFNSNGMRNIVTRKGDMGLDSSQIVTTNAGGISKGNAIVQAQHFSPGGTLLSHDASARAEDVYCRSWTTIDRYDRISKLVRHHGLWDKSNVPFRTSVEGSVLEDTGMVKIAPYITDKPTDPKKFMFSLENLAWSDKLHFLPEVEKGPGDFVSNKRGRIMWFPPYDIQFSESSSVNWESNQFIGRGENVYTYNNTERAGNLSFSVIVDHPSYINAFKEGKGEPDDHYVNSFWGGCIDPNSEIGNRLNVVERSQVVSDFTTAPREKHKIEEPDLLGIRVYFPNDNSSYNLEYENGRHRDDTPIDYDTENKTGEGFGLAEGSVADTTQKAIKGRTLRWTDRYNYGLNYSVTLSNKNTARIINIPNGVSPFDTLNGFYDPNRAQILGKFLTETCPHCVVTLQGFASKQGFEESNEKLSEKRSNAILKVLKDELTPIYQLAGLKPDQIEKRFTILKGGQVDTPVRPKQTAAKPDPDTDSLPCKKDRYVNIDLIYNDELAEEENANTGLVFAMQRETTKRTRITSKFYNEKLFFEKLTQEDPFVFDYFRENIRYFHPAFHSTTPEGLNSRLTFLLQCTRQGETLEQQGANNLAFGRPPVCILRIGDFYNTKIIIDNVSFEFEPLVWDLNPEGIGVQPMIAKVNMSFKFIGGSTLVSPLQKLQNALSFNYFANTRVYDVRADYFVKDTDPNVQRDSKGNILFDYSVRNGQQDLSDSETITNEELVVLSELPIDDQAASSLIIEQESQIPIEIGQVIVTGIKVKDNITSIPKADNKNEWGINIKLTVLTNSTDPAQIAENLLSQGTWSFQVKDVNSNESYQKIIDEANFIIALTPNAEANNFFIPIKGQAFTVTNPDGIKDSIGRENFVLSIMKDNSDLYKMNIKLK